MKTFLQKVLLFLRDHFFFHIHVSSTCRIGKDRVSQEVSEADKSVDEDPESGKDKVA